MPLIVIHGHDTIKLPATGTHKQRVAGERTGGLDPVGPRPGHRRLDPHRFFIAKQSAVAGMGIQGGHADPRLPAEQVEQDAMEQMNLLVNCLLGQAGKNVAESHVQRHMDYPEAIAIQHHRKAARSGALGQNLRVSRIQQPSRAQPFFVQGRGDNPGRRAGLCEIDGSAQPVVSRSPRRRTNAAGDNLAQVLLTSLQAKNVVVMRLSFLGVLDRVDSGTERKQILGPAETVHISHHDGRAHGVQLWPSPDDDFRPDPGCISHGDQQTRTVQHDLEHREYALMSSPHSL